MVKFSQSPLSASLLPLEPEQSQVAVESFLAVMRYMGDYPMAPQQTEVHCVYTILMVSSALLTKEITLSCNMK